MPTIEFLIHPRDWNPCLPEIGNYAGESRFAPSNRECPYCNEMVVLVLPVNDTICRIVKIISKHDAVWRVLGQAIPATHAVLKCLSCSQVFTVPKDAHQES